MSSNSVKFRAEYGALLFLALLARRLPRRLSLELGRLLGRLCWLLLPKRRRLADDNMRRALPEMPELERRQKVFENFEHIGISGMEMLRLDLFRPGSDDLERYFDLEGVEHLREAFALGRGVILLSGHFGFWEVGSFAVAELGHTLDLVAKPMKNPLVDKYFAKVRETFGGQVLNSRKGARRILKSLQAGHGVAILLDQHISPPGSVPVKFFGRPAYTTTAITNLAMKYQVPVVPIFVHRLANFRYRMEIEPMLLLEDGKGADLVLRHTQRLTERIEATVRQDVTQWFWMHKRWRVPEESASEASGIRRQASG